MQLYDPKKIVVPTSGLFNSKDKKRLVLLIVLALVIVGFVVTMQMSVDNRANSELTGAAAAREETLPTEVNVPKIDIASIEATAADERPEQRVVLPGPVLEAGFAASSVIFEGVYSVLGGRELTPQITAEILQAPKAHRGQLLRVRCFVEDMRELANPESADRPRYFVRGHLDDGTPVFFAAQNIVGLAPVPGDYVRMDGLFVRAHREEVAGAWIEAPLFIGPRMYESYARIEPVTEVSAHTFRFVNDDSVQNGIEGLDQESYWALVSYVKNLKPDQIDWETTPILDNRTISSIFADGTPWRGKPVRIPVALMLDVWKQSQPENPLREEFMLEGWIGRGDWLGQAKVARFVAPFAEVPEGMEKYVVGRAFFYKNLAYTPKNGGAAIAPFFVMQSLEEFVPPDSAGLRQMTYVVAGSLLAIGIGIFITLRRDKRSRDALEAELLRRRRERRQKLVPAAKP